MNFNRNRPPPMGRIERQQISMLQVDIHNHSLIARMMAQELMMQAKIDLERTLARTLEARNMRELKWEGDGGIFVSEWRFLTDPDATIAGGEAAFQVLKSVNGRFKSRFPEGISLSLRVSAHCGQVLTVTDPRYWHGDELNFFAKNERSLAKPGCFSITRDLRECLTQVQRLKFPESLSVEKVISDRLVRLYFHESLRPPQEVLESATRNAEVDGLCLACPNR